MNRVLILVLWSLGPAMIGKSGAAASSADWAAVNAVFVERCVMCHSAHGASRGLRLDSYEAAVAGSDRGAVLVAGDPAGSELIRRLRGESLPRMPLLSYPLSPEQIDLIARWIEAGLPRADLAAAPPEGKGDAALNLVGRAPPLR